MRKKRNKEGRAKTARPTSRLLCPRPPLGSFTKEMGRPVVDESGAKQEKPSGRGMQPKGFQPISSEPTPSHRPWASATGATPQRTIDGRGCRPYPNSNCNGGLRSGSEGPSLHQAIQRGAPTRRILIPRLLVSAALDSTPPRRVWMSPLEARPLADRFQITTRRKCPVCSVTFLCDPTRPFSVTLLNDLTRARPRDSGPSKFRPAF